jgi:hypothetical protein
MHITSLDEKAGGSSAISQAHPHLHFEERGGLLH